MNGMIACNTNATEGSRRRKIDAKGETWQRGMKECSEGDEASKPCQHRDRGGPHVLCYPALERSAQVGRQQWLCYVRVRQRTGLRHRS